MPPSAASSCAASPTRELSQTDPETYNSVTLARDTSSERGLIEKHKQGILTDAIAIRRYYDLGKLAAHLLIFSDVLEFDFSESAKLPIGEATKMPGPS